MKKIFILFLFVTNVLISKDCKWEWNRPYPQGNNLFTVTFTSKNVVYIIGNFGTLMKSTDSGITWNFLDTGYKWFGGFKILDSYTVILLVENNKIIKTSDGGKIWTEQVFTNQQYNQGYYYFIDLNNIYYISRTDSLLQKTTDGGLTWTTNALPSSSQYRIFYILNPDILFCAEKSIFMKSTDGGKNWIIHNTLNDIHYYSMFFLNENSGWVASYQGVLKKTTDGGETWYEQKINTTSCVSYYKFFDENNGYIFCNGLFCKTTNGGENWKRMHTSSTFDTDITDIDVYEDGFLIGIGDNGIIKRTTDFGYTWENQTLSIENNIYDITFTDVNNGWAVGEYNSFYKTTDAGKSWNRVKIDESIDRWYRIHFFNADTGIAAKYTGTFYKTTNGGIDWFKFGEITDMQINDLFFLNQNIGWITYWSKINEYFIYKTTNGGENWTFQKALQDSGMNALYFINENLGFAVGWDGIILKTTNGGQDWETNIIDTVNFNDVVFINENVGWICSGWAGKNGKILKTTDGGDNWTIQFSGDFEIRNICFANENSGWATTKSGEIFHTSDGGNNWAIQSHLTGKWLNAIYFLDEQNGWIAGNDGTILKYSCTSTDVEENVPISENTDLQIYPNPALNEITLFFPNTHNLNSISIFNSLGVEVKRIEQSNVERQNKITIFTDDLPNGLYNCFITNPTERITKSFVIVR